MLTSDRKIIGSAFAYGDNNGAVVSLRTYQNPDISELTLEELVEVQRQDIIDYRRELARTRDTVSRLAWWLILASSLLLIESALAILKVV